jgi:hypothetical protein
MDDKSKVAPNKLVDRRKWEEFRESGLLWFINTILHTFGWAIVTNGEYNEAGEFIVYEAYPARVRYRGFTESSNSKGYEKVSRYMKENADELLKEAKDAE